MKNEKTSRILIIDDQEIIRVSIMDYLEDQGFAVTEAENGRIGLELFKKNKPDLVLVDLRMPEIDGFEVLAGVTKESPETPAIVISGSDEIKDVVKSLHMGAWDYLLKPIQDLSVLLHTVQKNMERARLIRENRQYREYLEAEIDKRTEELRLANEGLRQENYARKKAEEELSKSEKMLDSILGTVPDIIYRIDPDGRIIFINEAVRAYGYTPEELQGKDVLDLVHPDDRDKVKYQITERKTGDRRTKSLEVRLINKEMSSVDFEIRSRGSSEEPVFLIETEGLYSSEGPKTETFLGTQGIARDITERKKAEKERDRLFNFSIDMLCIADFDGYIKQVNPSWSKALGWTEDELLKKPWLEFVHPDDRQRTVSASEQLIFGQSVDSLENRFLCKDGSYRWLSWHTFSLQKEELIFSVIRDITLQKQSEEALRESEERFKMAEEAANFGLWDWNIKTGEVYFSPQYYNMLGYEPDEMPPSYETWENLLHPEDKEGAMNKVIELIEGKAAVYESKFRLKKKSDGWTWIFSRGQVVARDGNGKPVRVVGTHIDITEIKKAREEKRKVEEQLIQSQKMESIGRLAGGVAHDFNNLLTAITGYSELSLRKLSSEDTLYSYVYEIKKAADRAADLTQHLLAFSRKQIISPKVVKLDDLISQSYKMLVRIIGEDINLTFHSEKQLLKIHADPSQINQVLVNLVVNAREAMPRGGELTVETNNIIIDEEYSLTHPGAEAGKYVVLNVSDTGSGMDQEILNQIYEPFFTTKSNGTGLGLSTVFGIVKQNNGFIEVESEPGKGTTFSIYLPEYKGNEEPAKQGQDSTFTLGKGTILLVEDERNVRVLSKKMLESSGYTVLEAGDGPEAYQLAKKLDIKVDLLLTDVVMPGFSGKELYNKVNGIKPDIKVLYMSGYNEEIVDNHNVLMDKTAFIQKPFTMAELQKKVKTVLGLTTE